MARSRTLAALVLAAISTSTHAADGPTPPSRVPGNALPSNGTTLEVKNVVGLVGQSVALEAILTRAGGGAMAGKAIAFRVKGTPSGDLPAGAGTTDGAGRARVAFKVPELKQASYDLHALFGGDLPSSAPAAASGHIGVFKAETSLSLSEGLESSAHHGHTNGQARAHEWFHVRLKRKTDGEEIAGRKVQVTLDGKPYGEHATGNVMLPDVPNVPALLSVPWTIDVRFEGDDVYQSTAPVRLVVKKKP